MHAPFRIYGADVSLFTAKARPAFRAKRVFTEDLLATPQAYAEVILPRVGMAFIPVVVTPEDETWQDTSDILDALEQRFPDVPLYPPTPVQRVIAFLWELYCDEFLIVPALHYRWSFPDSEEQARADFAATSGSRRMADTLADRIKAFALGPCGINLETTPAIEAHTHELLAALEAHFAVTPFLLGGRPSLADCALMGPMSGHLYRDAVPARLLRECAPLTSHWIQRMNYPDVPAFGSWLPDDALASSMRPMLELIGRDAVTLVLDTVRDFESWADTQGEPGTEPPRVTGMHRTRLRGVDVERVTSAYTLWMLQRPLDAYRALAPEESARVLGALEGTGCERLFEYTPRHRLGKREFKLVFAPRP